MSNAGYELCSVFHFAKLMVVYKIDRLSRSIFDFGELQSVFDEYGVSFCSVTQGINTRTSSGRMMLNILMTFAPFEREILIERVRDKVSAAKKRGKHCGGYPGIEQKYFQLAWKHPVFAIYCYLR